MIKLFDRVKVNIPTTGTGDISFGAAASAAFLTPAEAGVLDGDEVRYVIVDGLDFEEGVGLIKDTVATMERTVTKSKIGGVVGTSALNLSGTAVLALTASAADILTPDDNLASLVDADTALDNLGGTAVGKAVFTAVDQAAARAAIGVVSVPIGSILDYGSDVAPAGWLMCYGQNVSRTTYAALFSVISTNFGVGDGSTTFGIPDLRGRVVAGLDAMGGASANRLTGQTGGLDGDTLGASGGAETHTLTIPQIPSHNHSVNMHGSSGSTVGIGYTPSANLTNPFPVSNTGGGGAHNNVQPTLVAGKIIYAGA